MKKKGIPTAQMGRSYINRRGFKSAGTEAPKKEETSSKTRTTKAPATGSDITKYTSNDKSDAIKRAAERSSIIPAPGVKYTSVIPGPAYRTSNKSKSDGYEDYMKTVRGESFKVSDATKKSSAPKKSVKREKDEGIKVPERKKPELKVAAPLDKTLKGNSEKRKFSKGEIKIMEIMEKGKKKDGTMKEGAQRKIQAVRTKERLATQKIRNKAERAEKRYEVKSAKAKVKAVRKSFRK
jgi:hypothetical protein